MIFHGAGREMRVTYHLCIMGWVINCSELECSDPNTVYRLWRTK